MELTARVAMEVASHEALIRQAYKDSVGVWTWSVGLTAATGHDVTRYIGKPQTLEHCLAIYAWALGNYAEAVRAEFDGWDLTEAEFAGALSFHWNTGAIRSASWPDLWKAGKPKAEVRESFLSWRKPPEILERRKKEADLFLDGVWSNRGTMGEYTRLTSRSTPVWASRVEIDVWDTMERLLSPAAPPAPVGATPESIIAQIRAILATSPV